jgi:hypothetical protein
MTTLSAKPKYFVDSFEGTNNLDINTDIATRQFSEDTATPPPLPIPWVATIGATQANQESDYHQQIFGFLQLAGDADLPTALASPDFNFNNSFGTDSIVGKKISLLVMDAGLLQLTQDPGDLKYTEAAVTVCANSTLSKAREPGSGFSMIWVEDEFSGTGNFIVFYDGDVPLTGAIPNPVGDGEGIVEIFIDDPLDGQPWDGIGSTVIIVKIAGTEIFRYQKSGGGYTDNYITLEGYMQSNAFQLATHKFDDLTVFHYTTTDSSLVRAGLSLFDIWGINNGLGVYPNFGNDSDGDGRIDGEEFAVDGNPLDPSNDGKIVGKPVLIGPTDYLTLTFPVRTGADFAGTPSATIDGLLYFVQATTDLSTPTGFYEVIPAFETGLPALNPGYEYRTFTTFDDINTLGKTFFQMNVGPTE